MLMCALLQSQQAIYSRTFHNVADKFTQIITIFSLTSNPVPIYTKFAFYACSNLCTLITKFGPAWEKM